MIALAVILSIGFALFNVFHAWRLVRRKPRISGLFMLASSLLVIAVAGFVSAVPFTRVLLASGLIIAWLAAFLDDRIVMGKMNWNTLMIRGAVSLIIFLVGFFAV